MWSFFCSCVYLNCNNSNCYSEYKSKHLQTYLYAVHSSLFVLFLFSFLKTFAICRCSSQTKAGAEAVTSFFYANIVFSTFSWFLLLGIIIPYKILHLLLCILTESTVWKQVQRWKYVTSKLILIRCVYGKNLFM